MQIGFNQTGIYDHFLVHLIISSVFAVFSAYTLLNGFVPVGLSLFALSSTVVVFYVLRIFMKDPTQLARMMVRSVMLFQCMISAVALILCAPSVLWVQNTTGMTFLCLLTSIFAVMHINIITTAKKMFKSADDVKAYLAINEEALSPHTPASATLFTHNSNVFSEISDSFYNAVKSTIYRQFKTVILSLLVCCMTFSGLGEHVHGAVQYIGIALIILVTIITANAAILVKAMHDLYRDLKSATSQRNE